MKILSKFIFIAFILSAFINTTFAVTKGHNIKIKINGLKDTVCYLGYHYGDKKYISDTAAVDKNGICVFKGDKELDGGIYLVIMPNKTYFEIIVNEQNFYIETDTIDFIKYMKVTGSVENKLFNDYQRMMIEMQEKSQALKARLDSNKNNADSTTYLKKEITKVGEDVKQYRLNIIDKNNGTFLAKVIKAMKDPDIPESPKDANGKVIDSLFEYHYYRNHYFDNIDFSDARLLKTPILHQKVMEYLDNVIPRHPDSIKYAAEHVLDLAEKDTTMYKYFVITLVHKYESSKYMGMDAVFVYLAKKSYLAGKAYWADSTLKAKVLERVIALSPNLLGVKAHEMVMLDTNMYPVSLYATKAKYTVLIFYDYDCGHCKKSIPVAAEIYEEYKKYDVKFFAVCTVTDVKKWKAFINEHKLQWINVADPYNQSRFRDYYDIYSTPVIYILDENKEIIAKRIGVEQIKDILNNKLGIESKEEKKDGGEGVIEENKE